MAGSSSTPKERSIVAGIVLIAGFASVILFSITTIVVSADRSAASQLVMSSVLPLLGTWIGTVLAFYFARENLEAASATTLDALRQVGRVSDETSVSSVMIRADQINPRRDVPDAAAAESLRLSSLYSSMQQTKRGRVPIFGPTGEVVLVIHDQDIDKYCQLAGRTADSLADTDLVSSLSANDELVKAVRLFIGISRETTIGRLRTRLKETPGCADVFVTETGELKDPVQGWITDSDLSRAN